MSEFISEFTELKLSALSKSKRINSFVNHLTIGPNAVKIKIEPEKVIPEKPKAVQIETNTEDDYQNVDNFNHFKIILAEIEQNRKDTVNEKMNARKNLLVNFSKQQESLQKSAWHQQQQKMVYDMEREEQQILQAMDQVDLEEVKRKEKADKMYQELAERRKKHYRKIDEKEQKTRKTNKIMDTIFKAQQEFNNIYKEIISQLKVCGDEIKSIISTNMKNMNLLPLQMEEYIKKCKEKDINIMDEDEIKCLELLQSAKLLQSEINRDIEEYNREKQRLNDEAIKAQAKIVEEQNAKAQAQAEALAQSKLAHNQPQQAPVEKKIPALKPCLYIYYELQLFIVQHQYTYEELLKDDSMKSFRFECKKAVNIPVNAISSVSSQHLLDKYNKLHNLLTGKMVHIGNNPQGIAFSMNLLAERFVQQGDLMISSNPEASFSYAAVIVALWNDFPDFGKLILYHFQAECPYLVPIYLSQLAEESDVSYYKRLGYKYTDGVVEKQDKFLKRMTGIFRLYFAILLTAPKRGQNINPFDLSNGWIWFTNMLNLEPHVDITATALHVFFEVLGAAMTKTYGKQFLKLVYFIMQSYIVIIKTTDTGGPVSRLESLLQDFKDMGKFEEPKGQLPPNFW